MACFLISGVACTHAPTKFNAPITMEKVAFIPHSENKPMRSYLAMELPFAPYKTLHEDLEKRENLLLKNRGEAHITVISPVEYDQALKKYLPISEINKIALQAQIQNAEIRPVCIGLGAKVLDGVPERTYFVVIESQDLLKIREQIATEYVRRGGNPGKFKAESFFPHVTLGFTQRDLHFEDGVLKNKSSCQFDFNN